MKKNKANRELYLWNQKVKKHANPHANNCPQHISKHCSKCKSETSKINVSLILLLERGKSISDTEKKRNTNKICIQKEFEWQKHTVCAQKCIIWFARSTKPGPTALANILANYEFVTVTQSNFCDFLKQKTWPIRFEIFFTRKHGWAFTLFVI